MKTKFQDLITQVTVKFLLPLLVGFSIYIQVNGEISPGGGFQAGSLFASCLLIYQLINNKNIFTDLSLLFILAIGVLIYLSIGIFGLFSSFYLDYSALPIFIEKQSSGIILIEFGVAITVSSTLLLISNVFIDYDK